MFLQKMLWEQQNNFNGFETPPHNYAYQSGMTEQLLQSSYASCIKMEAEALISKIKQKKPCLSMTMYSWELHVDCTNVETRRIHLETNCKSPTEILQNAATFAHHTYIKVRN